MLMHVCNSSLNLPHSRRFDGTQNTPAVCNQGLKSRVVDSILTGADAEAKLMLYALYAFSMDVVTRVS